MADIDIKMPDAFVTVRKLNKNFQLDVDIVFSKEFHVRKVVAINLIKLAGWILGAQIEIKSKVNG